MKNNDLKRTGFKNFYVPELIQIFNNAGTSIHSVIDVGCGTGMLLHEFMDQGVTDVLGMDFCDDERILEIPATNFIKIDLNKLDSGSQKPDKHYQLACCLEVAEHLNYETADGLVEFLTKAADVIWFSAAIPYQGGVGHINEQWPMYWEEKFQQQGYLKVDWFRRKTWDKWELAGYYRQNMFLYVKKECLHRYPCLQEYYKKYNDILPQHTVHPVVYGYSVRAAVNYLCEDTYPKVKLQEKHIKNAKLLFNRESLLEKMPKGGIVAEFSTGKGEFSKKILNICRPKKLYCIDMWLDENIYSEMTENLMVEIESGVVKILKGNFDEQIKIIGEHELDFLYIAPHDYTYCKKVLEKCQSRIKEEIRYNKLRK